MSNESFDDETAVPPKDASSVVVDKDREDSEIFTEVSFRGNGTVNLIDPTRKIKKYPHDDSQKLL